MTKEQGAAPENAELKAIPVGAAGVVSPDSNARKEEEAIEQRDYDKEAREGDHDRDQGLKNLAYRVLCCLVIFGVLAIGGIAIVWLWHLLAPHCLRWLEPSEIDHIQGLLLSGALSSTITLLGSKVFKIAPKD